MPNVYKRKPGSTRGTWDKDNMAEAIEEVRSKGISLRQAGKKYHVPYGTLARRLKNTTDNFSLGPVGCLGKQNEEILANQLILMSRMGFPLDRTRIRQLAFTYAEKLGVKHHFNKEMKMAGFPWLSSFFRRNPELSNLKLEGSSAAKTKELSREVVWQFYDVLENEISIYQLQDKPQNISNCGETKFQFISSTAYVNKTTKAKSVSQIMTNEKEETMMVLACCTAEGRFLPPAIILNENKKKIKDDLTPGAAIYKNHQLNYINRNLFLRWFEEEFVPQKSQGRNILILDGHGSHCWSIELFECAEANEVSLISLPPNSINTLLPLHRTFFTPLKDLLETTANSWIQDHVGERLTRYEFVQLLNNAYNETATAENGIEGFSVTGIFPLNRYALSDYSFAVSETLKKQTIKFEYFEEEAEDEYILPH